MKIFFKLFLIQKLLYIIQIARFCYGDDISPSGQCIEKITVADFYQNNAIFHQALNTLQSQICLECQQNFVVSYDLQSCISYKTLPTDKFYFCKRLGRFGQCEEAQCGIQINEQGDFIPVTQGNKNENCAIFDSSTGNCVRPRLGYSLNVVSQKITKDRIFFCAIVQQGACIEYFSLFFPQSQYSVFLFDFANPQLIDNSQSIIQNLIVCQSDSDLIQIPLNTKYYGCVKKSYFIPHCLEYEKISRLCTKCEEGFSLSVNQQQCYSLLPNCLSHKQFRLIYTCILCKPLYYLQQNKCVLIENCAVQSDQNKLCGFCKYPKYGVLCDQISQNQQPQCELLNQRGDCAKCLDNESQYFDLIQKTCVQRTLSIQCIKKNYLSDQCDDFNCIDGFIFNVSHLQIKIQNYQNYINNTCSQLERIVSNADQRWKYFYNPDLEDYYSLNPNVLSDFFYSEKKINSPSLPQVAYCIQRDNIEGCIEYEVCFQSCKKCDKGYILTQRQDKYTDFYYRFICLKSSIPPIIIDSCIKYNDEQTQCIQCADSFYTKGDSCQLGSVLNCKTYSDNGICVQCINNYVLYNQVCYYIQYCEQIEIIEDFNILCSKCQTIPSQLISLVEVSNGKRKYCIKNPFGSFCSHYLDGTCIQCALGYVLIKEDNICIPEDQVTNFCYIADKSKKCIQCISGYQLDNALCIKVDGSCSLRYSCSNSACSYSCSGLNINNSPSCSYTCQAQSLQQDLYCNLCNSSLVFGGGCISCSTDSQCDTCDVGYIWVDDIKKCMFICENKTLAIQPTLCPSTSCNIPYCLKCDTKNPNICLTCFNSQWLQENQCQQDCATGYLKYLSNLETNNVCYKCGNGCDKCIFNNLNDIPCILCSDGFYLNEQKQCVTKCPVFTDNKYCVNFCPGFVEENTNKCIDQCAQPNFIQMNGDNSIFGVKYCVSSCPVNYFKYQDNLQSCTENCIVGYFPNKTTKICEKCTQLNCTSCPDNKDTCQNCSQGYYLEDNFCKIVCPGTQQLVYDPPACSKCQFVGCLIDCNAEGVCSICAQNFIKDQLGRCICPVDNGFILQYPGRCAQCNLPQCKKCIRKDFCIQCETGYSLQYNIQFEQQTILSETQVCVKDCGNGQYSRLGQCFNCPVGCFSCSSQNDCSQCNNGYIPLLVTKYLDDGTTYQTIECHYKCPDGSIQSSINQCPCSDENCKICSDDLQVCKVCQDNFELNQSNKCQVKSNALCQLQFCLECDLISTPQVCKRCLDGYIDIDGVCHFICKNGQIAIDSTKCSQNTLCFVEDCSECDYGNPNVCRKCTQLYPILISGKCFDACPEGYFLSLSNKCERCQVQCKTCNSAGCLTCMNPNIDLKDNCLCPQGLFLYKERCVTKCPFYSTVIKNICLEYCINGLYPFQTSYNDIESILCQQVTSSSSLICLQHLENLIDSIDYNLALLSNGFQLTITLAQTPTVCYSLKLRGKGDFTLDAVLLQNNNTDDAIYQVSLPDIKNMDQLSMFIDCSEQICKASIEVYMDNDLQLQISFSFSTILNIVLTNGSQFLGTAKTIQAVCSTCIIPKEQMIDSSVEITCPNNQQCANNQITAQTNDLITVNQVITDAIYKDNQIEPHSLKLQYINSQGNEVNLYISNYSYINSVKGQITYSFNAIALKSGKLVITSIINSAVVNSNKNRILQQSQKINTVLYPQFTIPLTFINNQDEEQDSFNSNNKKIEERSVQNNLGIIISASIGSIFIIIIISILIYKKCHKKQVQKNNLPYASTALETKKNSEDEMVFKMEKPSNNLQNEKQC